MGVVKSVIGIAMQGRVITNPPSPSDGEVMYIPASVNVILGLESEFNPVTIQDLCHIDEEYIPNLHKVIVANIYGSNTYVYGYKPSILRRVAHDIQEVFNHTIARVLIYWAFRNE